MHEPQLQLNDSSDLISSWCAQCGYDVLVVFHYCPMCRTPNQNYNHQKFLALCEGEDKIECINDHESMKQGGQAAKPKWKHCFACGEILHYDMEDI
jgi:hypothetical protein